MNNYDNFLKLYYDKAVILSNKFKKTRLIYWTPLDILNELSIQIGHVFNLTNKNCDEKHRNINNTGDELSDIILQLIALSDSLKIDITQYNKSDLINSADINDIAVVFGQLVEAVMEISNKRFYKNRKGYKSHESYIISSITKIASIVFNIADSNNLDMCKEFNDMIDDATNFLKTHKKENSPIEYVDIYNQNEEYIGMVKKEFIKSSDYYVKTVGCIFINPYTRKVYFQVKNSKHNNVHEQNYCEFTVGGHLSANEKVLPCLLRETKEEVGFNIDVNKLHFYKKRKQNIKIKDNYKIKEFQYYYIYVDNVNLEKLKPNYRESKFFVEVKIKDILSLIKNNAKKINGTIFVNNNLLKVELTNNNFYSGFFFEDELVKDILKKSEEYYIHQSYKIIEYFKEFKLIRKLKSLLSLNNIYYYNDNDIQVKKISNIVKNKLTYYVSLSKEDSKKYAVYIFIKKNNKIIVSNLLYKNFKNYDSAINYFYKKQKYIENNGNIECLNYIIDSIEKTVKIQ